MRQMKDNQSAILGFSADKRKRRKQHRQAAKKLLRSGGFFNCYSARGSTFGDVAAWHISQSRAL